MFNVFILIVSIYSYNVPLEFNSYQIGNYIWNFSKFVDLHYIFHFIFYDDDYYITFLDDLTKDDLPYYCSENISSFFSAVKCNNISKKCFPLISKRDFFAKKFINQNSEQKIIISGRGEPIFINDQYYYFEINHEFHCDKISDNSSTQAKLIKDDTIPNFYHLSLIHKSLFGCPSKFSPTLPISTPIYNPIEPYFQDQNRKINFSHLNSLSPYGIRTLINVENPTKNKSKLSNNKKATKENNYYYLFFQPSERIYCPFKNSCVNNSQLSSAWLCDTEFHKCADYGVYSNLTKYEVKDRQVKIVHHSISSKRELEISLECDPAYPDGFIKFDKNAELTSHKLLLRGQSSEACERSTKSVNGDAVNKTRFIFSKGDYKIDIDLSHYDYVPKKGNQTSSWIANVTSYGPVHSYVLYYQPTLSVPCPAGHLCSETENVTAFLCNDKKCTAYGQTQNGICAKLSPIGGIDGGVEAIYTGSENRTLHVTYECDRSNGETIRLPTGVKLNGDSLFFSVGAREACPFSDLPDPSPLSSVHLPMPKGTWPTPYPIPRINPDFFVRSTTHYVTFSADKLLQSVFRGNLPLLVDLGLGVMYTEYSPWDRIPCPEGWNCPSGNESNIWGCWMAKQSDFQDVDENESDVVPYCHPLGDRKICSSLSSITPIDLERGVLLKYCGTSAIFSELKIECDRSNSPPIISLEGSSTIFHRSLIGPVVSYNLSSSLVCPKKFEVIPFPLPGPTPSFDPSKTVEYTFVSPEQNNTHIVLDMRTFQQSEQWTVFRENETFELCFVVFNPGKQVQCPHGYNCREFGKANAWKCSKDKNCFPIGDSRYSLSFSLNDKDELKKGVSVIYGGGYAGFSFRVNMMCDNSSEDLLLKFSDVNSQSNKDLLISVSVSSSFACPIWIDDDGYLNNNMKLSPGSMFLLVVLDVIILYVSFGSMIMFWKTGIIELPNYKFWTQFIIDIKTAIVFIFTCGKLESNEKEKYSQI